MKREAVLSEDQRFRYQLRREWADGNLVGWIMLNPSTADHEIDDPTIRRCISFSRREGFGGMLVGNIYPLRTPYPKVLLESKWFVDSEFKRTMMDINLDHLRDMDIQVDRWVLGCGAQALRSDLELVCQATQKPKYLLGRTKQGLPRHPLYLRKDAQMTGWE